MGPYASELTGPCLHFIRAGHEVDICSPKGGDVVLDAQSDPKGEMTQEPTDLTSVDFKHHRAFAEQLVDTTSVADVDVRDGNLVTGQQQNSAALVAQLVLEALSER